MSLAFAIGCYSFVTIQGQFMENEHNQVQDSKLDLQDNKLDLIIKKVNENENNTTYIIVPSNDLGSGKISSLNISSLPSN